MRRSPFVAVVLGVVLVLLSLVASVRAQGTPAISQIVDFRVAPVDTNGNGKIDALVATFNVTVTVAGNFRFTATLYIGYGFGTIWNNTDVNLAVGSHAMSVSIPGPWIYRSGYSGPFDFGLAVNAVTDQGYMITAFTPVDSVTPAYNATDFEAPWAYFGSPITDVGVDSDADGLYNTLVVHVPVVVNRTTYVQIQGYLGSMYYYAASSLPTEPLYLTAGTHTLDLVFDGMYLRSVTGFVMGPQTVMLSMMLPELLAGAYPNPISRTTYVTSHSYTQSQFERSSASFSSTIVSTTPQDTNGNGLADFLVFHLPVSVRAAGEYAVIVQVSGGGLPGSGFPEAAKILHLTPGNTTVDLSVSGIALSRVTSTNPVAMAQIVRIDGGTFYDRDGLTWTMFGFQPSSFESRSVSTLTVSMTPSNATCGTAYAWDPTNRYLAYAYTFGFGSTTLQMPLYDGTFYLVVMGCGSALQAAARTITVSGSTSVTVDVTATGPSHEDLQISVPSWNSTQVRVSQDLGGTSGFYRLIADFFGNADGSADASELNNAALFLASGFGYIGYSSQVREDNRSLPFLSRFTASLTGAGSITSTAPLSISVQYVSITTNPPIAGDRHRLVVEAPYSPPGATITVTVSVGASAKGNLTLISRLWTYDGDGFTWPANATATKTGPQTWSIAVGGAPSNEPSSVQLEIVVDAYGTPVPASPSLLDYVTNPLAMILIIVAVAVAALALVSRRKKGPMPPSPPPT